MTYNITGPQELHGTQGQSGPTGLTPSLIFDGNVPRFFNWIFFKSIPEMIILTKEELTSKKRQRKIDKLCQKEQ